MQSTDWKSVSQHYVREVVHRAIENQQIGTGFQPTLLISASEDALAIARLLKAELRALSGQAIPVLTQKLQVYEDSNPYNVHTKPYGGSFSGQRVLLVDKADNTRASIIAFIQYLREGAFASAQAQAAAAGQQWEDPKIAVFVLHNKKRSKTAELPEGVQEFVGEEVEDVHIAYATSGVAQNEDQPQACHVQPSGTLKPIHRKSLDHSGRRSPMTPPPHHGITSPPCDTLRSLSSHYVETILENAVEEQKLQERFQPTVLVAASDGALAPARLLRHYLRHRTGASLRTSSDPEHPPRSTTPDIHDLPVLTPRLELYDEDLNPYLAHIHGVKQWGPASLSGQHVLVVDRVDETRATLSAFINQLQQLSGIAKAEAEADGRPWTDPVFGVFVLHNKKVEKAADLPADILADRYFYGAESEPVTVLYPFNMSTTKTLSGEISLLPQA